MATKTHTKTYNTFEIENSNLNYDLKFNGTLLYEDDDPNLRYRGKLYLAEGGSFVLQVDEHMEADGG